MSRVRASELESKAAAWRGERLSGVLLEGGLRLAGWSAAALCAAVWADGVLTLDQGLRWALWLAGLLALALGARALAWRPWRALGQGELLDAAAARFPETPGLREHLRSAWELDRAPADPDTSAELKAAHLARADELLRGLPARPVFPWKASAAARRAVVAGLAASAAWGWTPELSRQRVLMPWRDTALEALLSLSPGDAAVGWGGAAAIAAVWPAASPVALRPRELELRVKGPGGWRAVPWDSLGAGGARYSAEGLTAPLEYALRWRGLKTRTYRLNPVLAPRLDSLEARVRGAESSETVALSAAAPLSVLQGSWIEVRGVPNQPLAQARLLLSSWPAPLPMRREPSGGYAAAVQVHEDATMTVDLEAEDGRRDPEPPVFELKAVPDQPPSVELLSPAAPLQASPADTIPIAYSVKDDGGVRRLSLLVRPAGGAEREVPLGTFSPARRELLGDHPWELAGLPLGRVEFQLKAVDNASPPRAGLSAKGAIELSDLEAGHGLARKLWERAEAETAAAAAREAEAGKSLERRAVPEAGGAKLEEAWRGGARALAELSRALEADAYANPGLSAAVRALSERFADAAAREAPGLLGAARSGDWPAAAAAHERLQSLAARGGELLKEGRGLQDIEDLHSQAGRLSRGGSELEASLEGLEASSAGGLRDAQAALARVRRQLEALQKAIERLPKASADEDWAKGARELPLGAARETADALAEALARGDYAAAARLAEKLSEILARIQRTLTEAASASPAMASARRASERLRKAQALWSEVVEEQTRVLEETARLEDRRLSKRLEAQRALLRELSVEQGAIASSAAAAGAPPQALAPLRAAAVEFSAGSVVRSETELERVLPWLQAGWPGLAAREQSVLARLRAGARPAPEGSLGPEGAAAARSQAAVRVKTGRLAEELAKLAAEGVPAEAADRTRQAIEEQARAEAALAASDPARARGNEEKALALLEQAGQGAAQGAGSGRGLEAGLWEPFSRPGGGARAARAGATGSRIGYVALPGAEAYRPPRELREELKRAMGESRPESVDGVVKEYFRRIAQ